MLVWVFRWVCKNELVLFPVCMLLSLREQLQRWPQLIKCQRWRQCVKVPHLARQWVHLQRLLFTLSEDGLLYHTVFIIIIIISGCRSFLRRPLLLLVAFHKYILQRPESKEQDRWEAVELNWSVTLEMQTAALHHIEMIGAGRCWQSSMFIASWSCDNESVIGSGVSLQVSWCLCLTRVCATANEP